MGRKGSEDDVRNERFWPLLSWAGRREATQPLRRADEPNACWASDLAWLIINRPRANHPGGGAFSQPMRQPQPATSPPSCSSLDISSLCLLYTLIDWCQSGEGAQCDSNRTSLWYGSRDTPTPDAALSLRLGYGIRIICSRVATTISTRLLTLQVRGPLAVLG
jgi:hypothetical protein